MTDGLDYIRQEVAKFGKKARVTVIRWEINTRTGAQDIPIKIKVNGSLALKELSKPMNKRSYSWSKIRPLGVEPMKQNEITEGSLDDPILRSKLKDALRAEIEAELKAGLSGLDTEESPKKKKKKIEVSDEPEPTVQEEKPWVDPTNNDPYLA